jgi:PAS domain S-box-containing protein
VFGATADSVFYAKCYIGHYTYCLESFSFKALMTRSASVPTDLATADAFRTIAELGGDLAFILDCVTGVPAYVSAGVDEMLGYSIADLRAQMEQGGDGPLATLCAGLPERLRRFAAGDGSRLRVMREFDLRRPDGSEVAVEVISTLLLDEAGQGAGAAGIVRDVSRGASGSASRKRFASMLNHEFRTPLSTIDGAIQRLEATGHEGRRADAPALPQDRHGNRSPDRDAGRLPVAGADGALGASASENTVAPRCCWKNWWRRRAWPAVP